MDDDIVATGATLDGIDDTTLLAGVVVECDVCDSKGGSLIYE